MPAQAAPRQHRDQLTIKEMLIMPLHERDAVREQMEDCVFAGRDLTMPVPK